MYWFSTSQFPVQFLSTEAVPEASPFIKSSSKKYFHLPSHFLLWNKNSSQIPPLRLEIPAWEATCLHDESQWSSMSTGQGKFRPKHNISYMTSCCRATLTLPFLFFFQTLLKVAVVLYILI